MNYLFILLVLVVLFIVVIIAVIKWRMEKRAYDKRIHDIYHNLSRRKENKNV